MKKEVTTNWACPICMAKNPTMIPKPKPLQTIVVKRECEGCDSVAQIRFEKFHSTPGNAEVQFGRPTDKNAFKLVYEFIDVDLSEKAKLKMETKTTAQAETTKEF